MKNPIITKIISGLLNLLICLLLIAIVLIRQDFLGKGDIYAFLFWTIPLAIGLSISGVTILNLYKTSNFFLRLLLIIITSGLIAFGWVYFVYLILGPWINAFSFPIFYLWIIGNTAQLLFIDRRLQKPIGKQKLSKVLFRLFVFPLTLLATVVAMFFLSSLQDYFTRPEKEIYLIPANYDGEFRVIYGEKNGISPLYENGRRVLKIPSNGILIIKPKFKGGWINNEYYLVDNNGKRTKLNEIDEHNNQLTKPMGIAVNGSGSFGGLMPDSSFSSESPLAIHYTDFTVFNKDTTAWNEKNEFIFHQYFDSLTTALVDSCRAKNKK